MVAYSIVLVIPTSTEWIEDYVPVADRLTEQYGGKILTGSSWEQLEHSTATEDGGFPVMPPETIQIVIEWPNQEAAKSFMADPEYAPFLKMRTDGSKSFHYLVQGSDIPLPSI